MSRRRGALGPDDRALWDTVTKSVRPLTRPKQEKPAAEVEPPKPPPGTGQRKQVRPEQPSTERPIEPKLPPLAELDRRTRGRVSRGRIEIDARLDLHGHTLERALPRLERFLANAQAEGARLVLVITGKGGSGALRREVPLWLSSRHMRTHVIGYEEAAQHHGGAGALYVRIRRAR